MYNRESRRNERETQYETLLKTIRNKEKQAMDAKAKGMHSSFSILMEELSELRRRLRKEQMGCR